MGNTKFIRSRSSKDFTTISNNLIKDKRLSWKARAILIYILSLPDNWDINLTEIANHSLVDGIDSFRSGWKELEDLDYCKKTKVRNDKGHIIGYEYFISDQPKTDFPKTGKPYTGNPTQLNTNIQKTNKQKTNKDILSSKPDSIYLEVIDYLNEKAETQYRSSSVKTKSLIQARQSDGFTLDNFKTVIDNKVSEWKNTEMAKFIRPETLFGTKFESYLNQKKGKTLDVDWLKDHKMKWEE